MQGVFIPGSRVNKWSPGAKERPLKFPSIFLFPISSGITAHVGWCEHYHKNAVGAAAKRHSTGPRNAYMTIINTVSNLGGWGELAYSGSSLFCGCAYHEGVYRGSGTQLWDYCCCRKMFWCTQDTFHSCLSLNTIILILCNDFLCLKERIMCLVVHIIVTSCQCCMGG